MWFDGYLAHLTASWEPTIGAFCVAAASMCYLVTQNRRLRREIRLSHTTPKVQGIHRLPAHVQLAGHVTVADARKYVAQPLCSPFVLSLNGVWKFKLCETVDNAFSHIGVSSSTSLLDNIKVPGHWQLQFPGDAPLYTNIKYLIPVDPPHVPAANPTGYYKHSFAVPPSWSKRKSIIHFGGVDCCFYVYCNGVFVGFSKDSRLPAEFDLTQVLRFGRSESDSANANANCLVENEIEVIVLRFSDAYYLEDQDMFNLSGIFRDVYVYSVPYDVHIMDFGWKASMEDAAMQIGSVHVHATLNWDSGLLARLLERESFAEGSGGQKTPHNLSYIAQLRKDWVVSCQLFEEGQLMSSTEFSTSHLFMFDVAAQYPISSASTYAPTPGNLTEEFSIDSGSPSTAMKESSDLLSQQATVHFTLNIEGAVSWTAEKPHIYTLVLSLSNALDGSVVQAESCRLGLRTVDIANGLLRVNLHPLTIRGVNLHEFDPGTGHTMSPALLEADIKLMKRNNFNAIRTSHYPQTPWFYELCSLYGMYVVDEANIETHGMKPYIGRLADDPKWADAFFQRLLRMYERDKVHPCIIAWSLGNESGYGVVHDQMAAWVRDHDPSRILMYEPASYGPREDPKGAPVTTAMATDVLCPMYARIENCNTLANVHPDTPLILCEYAHMMGNSGGNLNKYWETFRHCKRLQGGFIWDWVDQGIATVDSHSRIKYCYGGDFGDSERVHDSNFCMNGLNWPDRGLDWVQNLTKAALTSPFAGEAKSAKVVVTPRRHVYGNQGNNCTTQIPYAQSPSSVGQHSVRLLGIGAVSNDENHFVPHDDNTVYIYSTEPFAADSPDLPRSIDPQPSTMPHIYVGTSVDVDTAMLKPVLLEAKQCMKCFECTFVGVKSASDSSTHKLPGKSKATESTDARSLQFTGRRIGLVDEISYSYPEANIGTTLTSSASVESASESDFFTWSPLRVEKTEATIVWPPTSTAVATTAAKNSAPRYQTFSPTFRFKVTNQYDHIDDLQEELAFTSVLLCDGIVVATAPLEVLASSFLHKDNTDLTDDIKQRSIQELVCEASFHVRLYSRQDVTVNPALFAGYRHRNQSNGNSSDVAVTALGVPWPEKSMLDAYTLDTLSMEMLRILNSDLSLVSSAALASLLWTDASSLVQTNRSVKSPVMGTAAQWGVVVVGRLSADRPWAPRGFPVGFRQINVPRPLMSNSLVPTVAAVERQAVFHATAITDENTELASPQLASEAGVKVTWKQSKSDESHHNISLKASSGQTEVEVIVSTVTGMFEQITVGGRNFLAPTDLLTAANYAPSRVQMHRAVTDNDRMGYLGRWQQVGLDRQMQYSPLQFDGEESEANFKTRNDGEEIEGTHLFDHVAVERIGSEVDGSQGVTCTFAVGPTSRQINKYKVCIMRQMNAFVEDDMLETIFYVRNSDEEQFVHSLAAVLQLGRRTVSADKIPATGGKGACVQVSKPTTPLCSTIQQAERIGFPPQGVPADLEDTRDLIDAETVGPITWTITYTMLSDGQLKTEFRVDASEMVAILPRIGIQLQIDRAFRHVSWSGAGPHESYPDRQTSCVTAVHRAPVDALYTPYIVPGENGSRTNVSWVQLAEDTKFNQRGDIAAEPRGSPIYVKISSSKTFNMSTQPFTTEDLNIATHSSDLERAPRPFTSMNIDPFLQGVGGDDSWTACVHEEFLVEPDIYTFDLMYTFQA